MIKTALKHRAQAYRNPVYIAYALSGIVLFWFGLIVARGGVGLLETYLFRFMNGLPSAIEPIFVLVSLAGTVGFVFVATIISLLRRHYAHAAKFLLAGLSSWLAVKFIKSFEIRLRPSEIMSDVIVREDLGSLVGFPSGHAAVATALGVVAYQYLPKKYHRFVTWLIVLVCLSRLYLGMHLPIDLVGGFGVGLAIASILNFVFGDTQGKFVPTSLVKSRLKVLHLDIDNIARANLDARGSTPFIVTQKDGSRVFLKIIDTTNNVADWLFKITRKVLYRRLRDESPFLTPKQQLEHEAYVAGLAFANGIKTPKILGIFHVREDMWGMAQQMINGKSLDKIDAKDVTPELITKVWKLVGQLHHANIIHRDLRAANVFIDEHHEPWLIDFGFSEASVSDIDFHRDTVELIASLSCIVSSETVIKRAVDVLGKDEIAKALPYMDYASLSGATTTLLKAKPGGLEEIRQNLQKLTNSQPSQNIKLKRFDFKRMLYIVMLGVLLFVLLPQIAGFRDSLSELTKSRLDYAFVALLFSALSYPAAASVYRCISPYPLKFLRTLLINISTSFTNRLLPASTGAVATNIRYLSKMGYSPTQASSITALNNLVGFIGHITILFIVAGLSKTTVEDIVEVPVSSLVLIIVGLIVLGLIGAVLLVSSLRQRAVKIIRSLRKDLHILFGQPTRFAFALLALW